MSDGSDGRLDTAVLRDGGCPEPQAEKLSRALDWPLTYDAALASSRVLRAAAPLLQERSRRVWRRQVSAVLVAAVATLPLSIGAGAYGIGIAYEILSAWLPAALATYLVATYAMAALAVLGATYALIPIAIGRSRDQLAFAQSWEGAR